MRGSPRELNFNLLFNQMGRLDLGHNETAVYGLRMRTEINRLLGVDSRMIGPREIKKLVPAMDMRKGKPFPIVAALYHPPCGVIRHDAVVWGYGRGASSYGIELHPFTEVTGIDRTNGSVTGVETDRGLVKANTVVSATAGWTSTLGRMVDLDLPISTHPLQAMVTEPLKPFLDKTISSANLHAYVYQTDRGEVVHRRWCRSLPKLQPPLHDAAAGRACGPHTGDVSVPEKRERVASMDRHLRHDSRLRSHHGPRRRAGRPDTNLRLG